MSLLQRLRNTLADSRTGDVLRHLGLARPALRLYERALLRRGRHTLRYQGTTLTCGVHDRFDVSRVDNFLRIERHLVDRICESIRPGDVMFDVGANIGMVSLLVGAAARDSGIDIHAFEPNPETARRARQNVALNSAENVAVHTLALGREAGTARLYTCGGDCGRDSMIPNANAATADIGIRVERGDEVARRLGCRPSVTKIDVEGAELDVLLGMDELLTAGAVRELFIEMHPTILAAAGHSEAEIVDWLKSRGMGEVWFDPRGTQTHRHFRYRRS